MSRVTPVRTCVGCRERATKSDLLRLVAVVDGSSWSVVPDLTGRMSGRGAHLHPSQTCLDQAVRRRALPRALRLEGAVDITAVQTEIAARRPTAHSTICSTRNTRTTRAAVRTGRRPQTNESGAAAHDISMRTHPMSTPSQLTVRALLGNGPPEKENCG